MRELALFAGAGGGILGGRLLGWRTVCAVECDEYARAVLMCRQDDGSLEPFPIWDDVRTFDGRPWRGLVDVVSGGFPCQDISVAGKGNGLDGERSGLWREWLASFARFDRDSRSWKTLQLSLFAGSVSSSVTWPRSGTMLNGECSERQTLEPHTSATESGLSGTWPTSLATESKAPSGSLTRAVRSDMRWSYRSRDRERQRIWATPTVCGNYNRKGASAASGDGLATQVKARETWPTPTAHNAKEGAYPADFTRNTPTLAARAGGALNPTWVEWLMGWPLGWTDLDASETDRYLKRRRWRSSRLQQEEDGQHE